MSPTPPAVTKEAPQISSEAWLRECSNDILYDYWMMLFSTYARADLTSVQNAFIAVSRIHWRSLAMFFYAEAPEVDGKWRILNPDGKSMGKDADLLARYFLPDWKPVNPPDWPLFLDEFQRTHKQIAHLSLFRARQRRHYIGDGEERFNKKEWRPGELAKPVIACMRAFLNGCAASSVASHLIDWSGGNFESAVTMEHDLVSASILSSDECAALPLIET